MTNWFLEEWSNPPPRGSVNNCLIESPLVPPPKLGPQRAGGPGGPPQRAAADGSEEAGLCPSVLHQLQFPLHLAVHRRPGGPTGERVWAPVGPALFWKCLAWVLVANSVAVPFAPWPGKSGRKVFFVKGLLTFGCCFWKASHFFPTVS